MGEKISELQEGIELVVSVTKVVTLADHGIRVVLDLPEDAIVEAAWLMAAKRQDVALRLKIVPV